jgi:hypothetical protein
LEFGMNAYLYEKRAIELGFVAPIFILEIGSIEKLVRGDGTVASKLISLHFWVTD